MTASFVDSNIWLYALVSPSAEKDMEKRAVALQTIQAGMTISEQVIAEVTVNLLRKSCADESEISCYLHDFYRDYQVIAPDKLMHLQAQQLRGDYCLSYWDSLIVAAALKGHCEILYTEDMQHGLLINDQIRVTNPFA